jgi:hypothetical protein
MNGIRKAVGSSETVRSGGPRWPFEERVAPRKIAPWWWTPEAWASTWNETSDQWISTRKSKSQI